MVALAWPAKAADTYKCVDQAGRTAYAERPCGDTAKRLDLPGDAARRRAEEERNAELLKRQEARERAEAAARDNRSPIRTFQQQKERCAALRLLALQSNAEASAYDSYVLRDKARRRQRAAEALLAAECI